MSLKEERKECKGPKVEVVMVCTRMINKENKRRRSGQRRSRRARLQANNKGFGFHSEKTLEDTE